MFKLIRTLWNNLTRLAAESGGLADDFAAIRRGLRDPAHLPHDDTLDAELLPAPTPAADTPGDQAVARMTARNGRKGG